jgi:hypothetical protein
MWNAMINNKLFFFAVASLLLPCFAGQKKAVVEFDALITSDQIQLMPWRSMGTCTEKSLFCIYIDTLHGTIIQLRKTEPKNYLIKDIDKPVSINEFQEGAYLTNKFITKKLKLVSRTVLTTTYSAKRGKHIIELNPDNNRIKNVSF